MHSTILPLFLRRLTAIFCLSFSLLNPAGAGGQSLPGLLQERYAGNAFAGTPAASVAESVDFGSGMPSGVNSTRWSGFVTPPLSGNYKFYMNANDRAKVWINDALVLTAGSLNDGVDDYWLAAGNTLALSQGVRYKIKVEHANDGGNGVAVLFWESASVSLAPVPPGSLTHEPQAVPPTISLSASSSVTAASFAAAAFPLRVAVSKPVTGLTASDFVVTGGTASNFVPDAGGYKLTLTPSANVVTTLLPAGVCVDATGLGNTASNTITTNIVITTSSGPLVTLTPRYLSGPARGAFSLEAAAVDGLNVSQAAFTVTNGTVTAVTAASSTSQRISVVPTAPGPVTVTLKADSIRNSSGVGNAAVSATVTYTPDTNGAGLLHEFFGNSQLRDIYYTVAGGPMEWRFGTGGISGEGGIPPQNDFFFMRSSGKIIPRYSETYRFFLNYDDGVELWIDGKQIFDNLWGNTGVQWLAQGVDIPLVAGREYDIKLTYREDVGDAQVFLFWQSASQSLEPVPESRLRHDAPPGSGGDTTRPTVAISGLSQKIVTGSGPDGVPISFIITPSEPINGLEFSDFELAGCMRDSNGDPNPVYLLADGSYRLDVLGRPNTLATVRLRAGTITDLDNNLNLASNTFATDVRGSIVLNGPAAPPTTPPGEFSINLSASRNMGTEGLTTASFVVTNGVMLDYLISGGGPSFVNHVARIRPTAAGLVTVSLPAGAVPGQSGSLGSVASNTVTVAYNPVGNAKPSLNISGPSEVIGAPDTRGQTKFSVTVTPSEPVTGLIASDFVLTGCTLDTFNFGPNPLRSESNGTYTLLLEALHPCTISVVLPAGVCVDADNQSNLASLAYAANFRTRINLTTSSAELAVALVAEPGEFNVRLELPVPFPPGDIAPSSFVVTNGSLLSYTFDRGSRYSVGWVARIRPSSPGTVTVSLPAGALKPAGCTGPGSFASNTISVNYAPGTQTRQNGVTSVFFNDTGLGTKAFETTLPNINMDWGSGSPNAAVLPNQFSARFTGCIVPPITGALTLHLQADDGARLFVNNSLLIDRFIADTGVWTAVINVTAGIPVAIKAEFREVWGSAGIMLSWSGSGLAKQVIPSSRWLVNETGVVLPLLISEAEDAAAAVTQIPASYTLAIEKIQEVGSTLKMRADGRALSWQCLRSTQPYLMLEKSIDLAVWSPVDISEASDLPPDASGTVQMQLPLPPPDGQCFFRLRVP